jgi:hypothetical protein
VADNPNKQVLMSSHSPYFIDWSDNAPEDLTLMLEKDGWVELRNLKGSRDLRHFLEEDPWGRDWVEKFFRAEFADDPLPKFCLQEKETLVGETVIPVEIDQNKTEP